MSKTAPNSFLSYALQHIMRNPDHNMFEFVQGKYYGGFEATLGELHELENYYNNENGFVVDYKTKSTGVTLKPDKNGVIKLPKKLKVVINSGSANSVVTIVIRRLCNAPTKKLSENVKNSTTKQTVYPLGANITTSKDGKFKSVTAPIVINYN